MTDIAGLTPNAHPIESIAGRTPGNQPEGGEQVLMTDPLLAGEAHVSSKSLIFKEGDQALSALVHAVDQEP